MDGWMGSADVGACLLSSLTPFINMVLRGEASETVHPVFFGANLFALTKDGGVCPIAVGNTLCCLTTKATVPSFSEDLRAELCPVQLGYSAIGGCEAAANAARLYLTNLPPKRVFLKIDMCNAFNCLRRDFSLS